MRLLVTLQLGFLVFSLLVLPTPVASQTLGEVFSTPEQRAMLDRQRRLFLSRLPEEEALQALNAPATIQSIPEFLEVEEAPVLMHLGGTLLRRDGTHTIWLNGLPISESELPQNVSLEVSGSVASLRIRTAGGQILLKQGQQLDLQTGVVMDAFELVQRPALQETTTVATLVADTAAVPQPAAPASTDAAEPADAGTSDAGLNRDDVLEMLRRIEAVL